MSHFVGFSLLLIDVVDEKKHSDDEKSDDDGDKGDRTDTAPSIPGFSQYLYFLFAPTLVYRDSYPQ